MCNISQNIKQKSSTEIEINQPKKCLHLLRDIWLEQNSDNFVPDKQQEQLICMQKAS